MDKFSNYYGIDISKDVFDVMDAKGRHFQFTNDQTGFKNFLKEVDKNGCFVMEATGVYHT